MDVVLEKLSCDSSLPLSIAGDTFRMTCNKSKRCSLEGDTALMEGQFILNGIQDVEMEHGKVYFSAYIDTASLTFEINEVSASLCNHAIEENLYDDENSGGDVYNGDDAYNADNVDDANGGDDDVNNGNGDDAYNGNGNDANNDNGNNENQCELQDGTYNFSTKIQIPGFESTWSDTGWAATGQVSMYTYEGTEIGSCDASFRTLSADGPSSKTAFLVLIPIAGMVFFFVIYVGIRRAIRSKGDLCGDDLDGADDFTYGDDSTYKTTGETITAMSTYSDYTIGTDNNSSRKTRETDANNSTISRETDTNSSRNIRETDINSVRKNLETDAISSQKTCETDTSIKTSHGDRSERSKNIRVSEEVNGNGKSGESDRSESGTSGIQEAVILGNHNSGISNEVQSSKPLSTITRITASVADKVLRRPARQQRQTSHDDATAYQCMEEANSESVTAEETTAYHCMSEDDVDSVGKQNKQVVAHEKYEDAEKSRRVSKDLAGVGGDLAAAFHYMSEDDVESVGKQNKQVVAPEKYEDAEKSRRVSKDLAAVGGDLAAMGGDMMSTLASAFFKLARSQDVDNKDATLLEPPGEKATFRPSSPKKSYRPSSPRKGKHVLPDDCSVQAVALERQGLSGCSDDTIDSSVASSIAND